MKAFETRDRYAWFGPGCAELGPVELMEALDAAREAGARVAVFELAGTPAMQWNDRELLRFERHRLPTMAVVTGEAGGHTAELALACDLRVAAPGAGFAFARVGTRRMILLLGTGGATEVLARGGRVEAAAALDLGLVSHVAGEGEGVGDYARALAATIASRGPIATELAKEATWRGLTIPFEQALRFETDLTMLLQTTTDRAEGVRAFLEKRPPQFTGK
nr:hypothetical protein [Dehalococcoidia bacterium]